MAEAAAPPDGSREAFQVRLDVFEGPFDLLLQLIAKHQLDVTEVALSQVTDDFIAHLRGRSDWDLGQATEFLVVAATLLDLKAARLLPGTPVEDDEDLALLEARDLLFARLLQYRAYKLAAAHLAGLLAEESRRHPRRQVALEPRFAGLLPEVLLGLGPQEFAALATRALTPRAQPSVDVDHVHGGHVSVREQTALLTERLRHAGGGSFRFLTADCSGTLEVVARFLGLLELYREGLVSFDQAEALGELRVRWTGSADGAEPTTADAGGAA